MEAQQMVAEAISSALRDIDLRRSITVQRTADSLDGEALEVLEGTGQGKMKHPQLQTVGEFVANFSWLQALNRLLEMGLVQPAFPTYSAEQLRVGIGTKEFKGQLTYRLTDFGKVVLSEVRSRLGLIRNVV